VNTIKRTASGNSMLAAAIDGPLVPGLGLHGRYRSAEQMLTLGIIKQIGKPGQTSSRTGRELNEGANDCARDVLALDLVSAATHPNAIHKAAIAEAFPTTFLGLMLKDPRAALAGTRQKSDRFYAHLAETGQLAALLAALLPSRPAADQFSSVTNHDDRAALVCALTALCVASSDYSAVGDETTGWIILPPLPFLAPWVAPALLANRKGSLSGQFVAWNKGRALGL
jgi:hypothetical protein